MLDLAVGMEGEPAFRTIVDVARRRPGPPPKLGAAVVVEGFLELLWRVHDERSQLKDRRTDRPTLQQQELGRTTFIGNERSHISFELNTSGLGDPGLTDRHPITFETM